MASKYRLGIDAGGTFTDFVFSDNEGNIRLFKSTSTPDDGTQAIDAGLQQISAAVGRSVEDILADTDLCINGTTIALNALIQFKGVKVGLICTAGHEDSIEIRLGHKEDGHRYDAKYPPARMLVPRYLRVPVRERIRSDGKEHTVSVKDTTKVMHGAMAMKTADLKEGARVVITATGDKEPYAAQEIRIGTAKPVAPAKTTK